MIKYAGNSREIEGGETDLHYRRPEMHSLWPNGRTQKRFELGLLRPCCARRSICVSSLERGSEGLSVLSYGLRRLPVGLAECVQEAETEAGGHLGRGVVVM